MKKLTVPLFVLAVIYLLMTFFVAELTEKQLKKALVESEGPDLAINLLSYQRHFFTATAISKVHITLDQKSTVALNITSTISHYPFQAAIKNEIKIADKALANRAESYFGTPNWLRSEEKVNLFSQLTGQLNIASGKYESENEVLSSGPVAINYQVDLNNKSAKFNLDWVGISSSFNGTDMQFNSLQLSSHLADLSQPNDYDYKLIVDNIEIKQKNSHSLLEELQLIGRSRQGIVEKTIDTSNELLLRSYQFNNGLQQMFTNNSIKLALIGLYQPAFESLNRGADDEQEFEDALVELVNNGAQLTLSQLNSNTPWGEVDGQFDFTLDKGASLVDIMINPYVLLDYIEGDLSLVLPATLLNEPLLAESLQMGLMTGFLVHNEQTLNLETSFQQGELIVNGRVIPL